MYIKVNVSMVKFPYSDEQLLLYTLCAASQKLGIFGTYKLVLEDGTEVDDDDVLQHCLKTDRTLVLLRNGERMTTAGGIFYIRNLVTLTI